MEHCVVSVIKEVCLDVVNGIAVLMWNHYIFMSGKILIYCLPTDYERGLCRSHTV